MKKINLFKVLFLFTLVVSNTSLAQIKCESVFSTTKTISQDLKKLAVTAGEVSLYGKKIPVILANKESVEDLIPIYNQSIGIVVAHQKGYNNDHGLFRISDIFIDRDTPGARHRGEIHNTGISWASVIDYTNYTYKLKNSYNRVEVLFKLSEQEYNIAMIYQKMRRAAIIRPDFSFGGDSNPKNVNNRMTDCGEICFSFSTGSSALNEARSAQRYIEKNYLKNFEQLIKTEDFLKLFASADQYFLEANFSEDALNPLLVNKLPTPTAIKKLNLSAQHRNELVRWIIGYKISQNFADLLSVLEITNSSDYSNVRSSRASAVLIYDGNVSKSNFATPDYTSVGVFSTWKNTDFKEIKTAQ